MKENLRTRVPDDKQWRIRKKVELQKDVNIGIGIKLHSLRWMGHLERMADATQRKHSKPTYTKNDLRVEPQR